MMKHSLSDGVWPWLAAVVLLGIFIYQGVSQAPDYVDAIESNYERMEASRQSGSDFVIFYVASETMLSGQRHQMYDGSTLLERFLVASSLELKDVEGQWWVDWIHIYNPPLFLLALAPLTALPLQTAYLVMIVLNLVATGVLLLLAGKLLRWRQPHTLLFAAAVVTFEPWYFAMNHAQPTIILAIVAIAAFLAHEGGRRWLAAALVAVMGMKPQWVLFPGLALLRSDRRYVLPLLLSGLVILALPFALVGPEGVQDYLELLLGRGSDDVGADGYSTAIMSWSGFFSALMDSPQPLLWVAASGLTLGLFVMIAARGEPALMWAAAMLVTLIVIPHSHPQDWMMAVPAAALLVARPMHPLLKGMVVVGLLALYLGANDWSRAQASLAQGDAIYWVTPATFAVLLLIALLPWLERRWPAPSLPAPEEDSSKAVFVLH